MTIKISTHIKWLNKIKREKKQHAKLHILEILSKNKYLVFFKINSICIKQKKNHRWIRIISSKIKHMQNNYKKP